MVSLVEVLTPGEEAEAWRNHFEVEEPVLGGGSQLPWALLSRLKVLVNKVHSEYKSP